MTDEWEETWSRLRESLPERGTVGEPSYDPGAGAWSISAVGPDRGRGKIPTSVPARGEDGLGAVRNLDARLRGELPDAPRNLDALRARLRLAYLDGAEERSWRALGRGLTEGELGGVISRFPRAEPPFTSRYSITEP